MKEDAKITKSQRPGLPAHILAKCPRDIPYMVPDRMLPDADCDNCINMKLKAEGEKDNHCYMFAKKPGDKCGQFKQMKMSKEGEAE